MTYDQSGDNIGTGGAYGGWMSGMWIFALVILALFFLWGRDGKRDGYEGSNKLVEGLALGKMMQGHGYNGGGYTPANDALNHREHWDTLMMTLQQFGDVKKEVVAVGHQNAMDNARYFYEQRGAMDRGFYEQARLTDRNNYDTAIGFKQSEIGNLVQTKEILGRIDKLENGIKEDKIRELESKVNYFETVQAVRGWGIPPAHPVAGPIPYPFPCNPCHP